MARTGRDRRDPSVRHIQHGDIPVALTVGLKRDAPTVWRPDRLGVVAWAVGQGLHPSATHTQCAVRLRTADAPCQT